MIVHNKHVTDAFEEDGIYTLDGTNRLEILKQVEKGTVIFTAHGVWLSPLFLPALIQLLDEPVWPGRFPDGIPRTGTFL